MVSFDLGEALLGLRGRPGLRVSSVLGHTLAIGTYDPFKDGFGVLLVNGELVFGREVISNYVVDDLRHWNLLLPHKIHLNFN